MSGQTSKYHIVYPNDYSEFADIPKYDKEQAESIEEALELIDVREKVGDLDNLETENKTNIVESINEIKSDMLDKTLKGANNGLAELDENGKVPSSQLPSYVDDVIEGYYYNNKFYKEDTHITEIVSERDKIYMDLVTNKTYRWSGTTFTEISESLALGETEYTAYRGDKGKEAFDRSKNNEDKIELIETELKAEDTKFSNILIEKENISVEDNNIELSNTVEDLNIKVVEVDSNKLEQDTRKGYNLWNLDSGLYSQSGIKTINLISGDYVLSFYKERISGATITNNTVYNFEYIKFYDSNNNLLNQINGTTVNLPSGKTDRFSIPITAPTNTTKMTINFSNNNGDNNNNTTVQNIQIVAGTIDKPYELYGAMPSIDYPSDIQGITGDITGRVRGDNIFDGILEIGGFNNDGINVNSTNRIRSKNYIKVNPGDNIYFPICNYNKSKGKISISVSYYSTNDYITSRISYIDWGDVPLSLIIPNNCYYIRILFKINDNELNLADISNVKIYRNIQPITLSLGNKTLYKGDGIDTENKKFALKFKKYIFTENDTFNFGTTSGDYTKFYADISNIKNSISKPINNQTFKKIYCNMFKCVQTASQQWQDSSIEDITVNNVGNITFSVLTETASTVQEFINNIVKKGLYIVYPLAETEYEDITDTTLLSQLNSLLSLKQYDENTIIEFDEDVFFSIEIEKEKIPYDFLNNLLNNDEEREIATIIGESINITDSAKKPCMIELTGNTDQETRSGVNLVKSISRTLPSTIVSPSTSFLDFNIFIDKKIKNNYSQNGLTFKVKYKNPLSNGAFSNFVLNTSWETRARYSSFTNRVSNGFNISEYYFIDRTIDSFIESGDNVVFKMVFEDSTQQTGCELYDVQVNLGNTVGIDNWEKYGVSPSIDYPSNYRYTIGEYDVLKQNSNLFDGILELGTILDGINSSYSTAYRSKNYLKINNIKTLYWTSNKELIELVFSYYDKNKSFISQQTVRIDNSLTIPSNCEYLRFRSVTNDFSKFTEDLIIQIEYNSITNIVEHQEQTLPINLKNYKLAKVGTAQDHFNITYIEEYGYKRITAVNYVEETADYTFTGNEIMTIQNNNKRVVVNAQNNNMPIPKAAASSAIEDIYCNILKKTSANNTWAGIEGISYDIPATSNYIAICINSCTTVAQYQQALKGNKILYELATPITTPVTDDKLIQQLEKLINTFSYHGVTNIDVLNDDSMVNPLLKVTYEKSNLIRLQNLEQAILNS